MSVSCGAELKKVDPYDLEGAVAHAAPAPSDDPEIYNPFHPTRSSTFGTSTGRANSIRTQRSSVTPPPGIGNVGMVIRPPLPVAHPSINIPSIQDLNAQLKTRIVAHAVLALCCILPVFSLINPGVRYSLRQYSVTQPFSYTAYATCVALSILNVTRMLAWRTKKPITADAERVARLLEIYTEDLKTRRMTVVVLAAVVAVGMCFQAYRVIIVIS